MGHTRNVNVHPGTMQPVQVPSDWTSPRSALTRRRMMPRIMPNLQQPNAIYSQMAPTGMMGWQQWLDAPVAHPSVAALAPVSNIQVHF